MDSTSTIAGASGIILSLSSASEMEKNPFVQAGALSTDLGEIPRASPFPNPFDQAGAIDGGVDQLKDSCRFIPLCHILKATNDFDDALVTGAGGFGKVYKASIDDGATTTVVAIKRLSAESKQGAEEFWTELKLLSKFRHANLVSLIGYCDENQEMIIVYEYIARGTLANHLYKTSREESGGSRSHLTWEKRLNICLDVARGLDYLHNGTLQGIIHRDVKSTNILLDEHLVAKVADLGLSKSTTTHTATHVSTCVKGTFGYLDPDYFFTQRLSKKSDVYAFGVVLLEVLCGRPAIDRRLEEEQISLAHWAQMNIKEGTLDRIIDPSLNGDTTPDSLEYFAELANKCLHIQPKERPTMTEVVKSLQIALVLHERQGRSQGTIAKAWTLGGLLPRHRNPLLVPPNEIQKSSIPANSVGKTANQSTTPFRATISKAFDDSEDCWTEIFMTRQENIIKKEEGFINEHLPDHVFGNSKKNEDNDETVNKVYHRKGSGNSVELKHWATFKKLGMDPGNKNNKAYHSGVLLSNSKKKKKIEALKRLGGSLIPIVGLEDYNTPVSFQALSGLSNIFHGLLSGCGHGHIILLNTNHNHIDKADVALQRPSSPQPKALPDGGEIVLLDSSEQKPSVGFDATNKKAYQSDVLVSNSEEKNPGEASRRQCMPEGVLSLVDSTTSISSTYFDAPDNSAHFVREYQSGPIVFNSEKKDMREGLNRECLTKSALSLDDSPKPRSLPDFDATENKAVKVYTSWGRGCWHSMEELEQGTTLEELGMDPENEGIISDLLRFVSDKEEFYKKAGKDWNRGYLLYDSPGTDRSSLIAAMANFLEFDIYHLDLMGLTSISELTNVLVSIQNRSLIAIKDFDQWAGKLPDFKTELTPSDLLKIIHGLLSRCGDEQIIVLTTNHNHIGGVDVTLLRPLNIDLSIHTSSPQPKALPDGGEIVLLYSSEQKPLVYFDATNKRAYRNGILVSNSEEKNTREASRRQCMPEGVLSLADSTIRISLTDFDVPDNSAHFVREYQSGPIVFNSEKKDTGKGLNSKCLTKSALSLDDLAKPRLLLYFDATENTAVKVDTRPGRGWWHPMGFEQQTTLEELGMDPGNEGIISDLLRFVRDKEELYKDAGKDWKRGYLLYDSPGTDRSSLIAAMANFLEFDIYHLDLMGLTTISELTNVLVSIRNCSLIAIKNFDCWFAMLPNLMNELTFSGLLKIIHGLLSSCGDEQIIVLTTNHIDRVDVALLRPLNIDLYVHTSSPQLKALPDGGEIVLLESSEHKPSVDFYATNNRAYQSDVLVSNSEEKNMREASRRQYMPEHVLSLVDSTARISSTDFDASDNRAHFVRAYQSGPLVFNSEKKDTGEGLSRECLTKSVLSLDDSSKQKSLSDDAVTEKKSHLVIAYQSGPIVSLSNDKNRGEPLKRECFNKSIFGIDDLQQHSGGRRDDAAKSFCEARIIHIFSSSEQQAFDATNAHLVKADERGPTVSNSEKGCTREALKRDCLTNALSLEDLQQHFGARRKDAVKGLCDSPAWKSIEVLDSLPLGERSNNIRHLAQQRALMHKHCVRLKKSQDLLQSLQRDCSGGLASQSDIGLPDGEHILSLLKKKIVRKTLKRKGRTMSVLSLEDHQQHFGRRWEDAVTFLGSKRTCRQLAIHSGTTAKHIRRQLGTHRWPFKQSAIGFPDGGHILSLSEKKIVRKTLKRKCRNTSVLRLEDHEQHVDRWWEDAAKSHGAKRICRQLGIHRFSTAKRTHKQHGIHQWPFQRSAIGLPDGGHILSLSEKKIVRKILKRKCRSMSVLSSVDRHQHVDRRWEDAAKNIGAKRICRQLVIHGVSIAKRICRQHGIHHRWPFELDRVTMKGYTLGDERPVEVIRLSTDGKLVSRLQVIYISWLGRFSPPPSTLPRGEIVGHIALSSSQFGTTNSIAQRVGQDQSGSASSDSENERTREQENPKKIYTSITKDDLLRRMHKMNREDAATSLNISVATFKRKCREFGIQRWPHVRKEKVGRPPDQHGERNTSTACKMPLHNVHARMEGEPVGQNQEANEFRPYFMEHSIALSTENDSIIAVYSETEAARGSSEWTFQLEGQTMQSTTYPYRDDPVFSQSQIASTEVVNENMGSLQDRRDLLASQVVAPQKEPLLERHVFGFGNWTVGSCSDLASSQTMRTFSHPTGSLENLKNWLASVEEHLMEENVYAVGDGDGDERRAPVEEGRTPVAAGPEGLQVRQLDPISGVEGLVITGLGSLGAGSSGSGGGDGGDGPRTPPRDPARGKGPVVEERVSREVPAEEIEFRPAVGSSAHVPITRGDFAEFVTEEELGRLFRENPRVVTAVIQAREDRQRQVERAQEEERWRAEAERAAVEGEAFVREAEAAEQVPEEGGQAQERAVAVAEARRRAPRAEFVAETYVPPEPHLFVPSGVDSYLPRQESYDAELVLRDPERHLSVAWAQRGTASTREHGSPTHSLELYKKLPERVRALVDAAGFRPFILTLTVIKSDHALLTALAERWWDSSNTFHLPIGEMTVTPADFAALTGLRVGGEAIPFDSGIHEDEAALRWFLGRVPEGSSEMVPHNQFHRYLTRRVPSSVQEEEQMARAYLLYLFGATLYPNKRATVHLSYLPALQDLQTVSRYDWGGAALGACYSFMGEFSRGKKAIAGYWRVWELWAYEVLKMYPPENTCPDLRMLPRALIWGPVYRGKKKSRGSLLAFRVYLDELSGTQVEWDPWRNSEPEPEYLAQSRVVAASRVLLESAFGWQWYLGDRVTRQSLDSSEFVTPGPLPPRASHTGQYTLAELQRFTVPADLTAFLRTERNYAVYRRQHLARPLGVMEHVAVESEAREAGEERRGRSNGVFRSRERSRYATAIGLPRLSWTLAVRDAQGDEATVRFEPARTEPAEITGPAPMEWVREAVRLMKAMEKEFHKIAGGASLQLHYPPPVAAPVLQPQGQPRAASRRKSVRPPPQKKVAERTSRVAERTQRGVEIVSPSNEPQFHRELRKRPAEKRPAEGPLQKRRREEEEEEEEEEEQQQQSSFSIGSDSASDPRFWVDPWEVEDTNDDDDDLEDLFDD